MPLPPDKSLVVIPQPDDSGDGLLAGKLETVGELALDWCNQILRHPLPGEDSEQFGTIARAKGVAAQTGLHTLMRVNEMRLKRAALGKLPELLRRIREEEKKLPLLNAKQ